MQFELAFLGWLTSNQAMGDFWEQHEAKGLLAATEGLKLDAEACELKVAFDKVQARYKHDKAAAHRLVPHGSFHDFVAVHLLSKAVLHQLVAQNSVGSSPNPSQVAAAAKELHPGIGAFVRIVTTKEVVPYDFFSEAMQVRAKALLILVRACMKDETDGPRWPV